MSRGRGHTLLEVFLAMLLITLLVFSIVSLYPGLMACLRRSHDLYVGSSVARQAIEEARATPFTQVVNSGPVGTTADVIFETTVTVNSPGDPNLKALSVTTRWNGTSQTSLDYLQYNFLNPP